MQDFLLNKDFSMLQIPSDNLIPQTTGAFTMLRTLKLKFNVENRTFNIGYLNSEIDTSVRNSSVHRYYLALDTRLFQFIEFLASLSDENERNSKISNVCQVILEITYARLGQVYYNILLKGDSFGVMKFKPSKLKKCGQEVETDLSTIEPLIDSIINEEKESYPQLRFHLNYPAKLVMSFRVNYSDYDYFRNRGNHMYDIVVDSDSLEFLEFLRTHYPSVNPISSDIEEIYVRVSEKKKIASLIIYGTNNSQYEQIDFVPRLLEDSDPSNTLPQFDKSKSSNHSVVTESQVKVEESVNTESKIIFICREIVNASDQASDKIKQLRQLLQ